MPQHQMLAEKQGAGSDRGCFSPCFPPFRANTSWNCLVHSPDSLCPLSQSCGRMPTVWEGFCFVKRSEFWGSPPRQHVVSAFWAGWNPNPPVQAAPTRSQDHPAEQKGAEFRAGLTLSTS